MAWLSFSFSVVSSGSFQGSFSSSVFFLAWLITSCPADVIQNGWFCTWNAQKAAETKLNWKAKTSWYGPLDPPRSGCFQGVAVGGRPAWCMNVWHVLQSWWIKYKVLRATFLPSLSKLSSSLSFLAHNCSFSVQKAADKNSPSCCLLQLIFAGFLFDYFLGHEFQSVHLSFIEYACCFISELVYEG